MTGRQESNEKTDFKTKKKLESQPRILTDYYYGMTGKTAITKYNYISYNIPFLDYLKRNSIDINTPGSFGKVKPSDITRYMEEEIKYVYKNGKKMEAAESTRAPKFYAIRNFFDFLINEGYVEHNPCANIEPPRIQDEREVVAMDPDEIAVLKGNIPSGQKTYNRDMAIVALGCTTGLRVRSITEINMGDIDFNNGSIVVREKGNKERTIYIGRNTSELLKKWISDRRKYYSDVNTDALFISLKRNRISVNAIENMIKKYSRGINKHITPHKMRSSCATNLYEKTGDIYIVQEVLGHKNIKNTRRYAKVTDAKRRAAIEILDSI